MFILEESLLLIVAVVIIGLLVFMFVNNSKIFNKILKKLRFKSEEELEENKPNGKKRK